MGINNPGSPLASNPTAVRDVEDGINRQPGQVNGLATLGADGTLTASQVPASIANGLTFQAVWNANTNSPTLPPVSTPNPGDYWIVTTAGATALPGAAGPWTVGQVAVFNGTDWDALSMYPLAIGLPVAGASAGDVLYVTLAGNLAYAAPGATSGVQAYSSILGTLVSNGAPGTFGLARLLDANVAAAQAGLGLGDLALLDVVNTDQVENAAITLAKMDLLPTMTMIGNDAGGDATPQALTASEIRTLAGLGTMATINSPVPVANGGTAGTTPAAARDGVLWASAASIDPASVYTVAAGIDFVSFASSKTAAPRALSNYVDGQLIRFYNSSASTITITITPADGTIDGAASVALSVPSKGIVGCVRLTSSTWGSVQPGSLSPTQIVIEIDSGALRAYGQALVAGTWTRVTGYVAPSASGDPESWGSGSYSLSGSDLVVGTDAGVLNTTTRGEAPYWSWSLAELGIVLPAGITAVKYDLTSSGITLTSAGATDYSGFGVAFCTSATASATALYCCGLGKATLYARLAEDETTIPVAGGASSTLRRALYTHMIPLQAVTEARPYTYYIDGSNIVEFGAAAGNQSVSGTPTHIAFQVLKLNTPRAGTISAPRAVIGFC